MKNIKPLLAFIICLWAVVVVTYAKQVRYDQQAVSEHQVGKAKIMQINTSCSSSSSSSGE